MALVSLLEGAVYADSGYWQDIQNAVDEAQRVGIKNVILPEGTFNYVNVGEAWHTIMTPAGINVFGAGCLSTNFDASDQLSNWLTILVMPYDVPSSIDSHKRWFWVLGSEDPAKPTRISGFAIVGYRYYDNSAINLYEGIRFESVIGLRADHLLLQDICGNGIVVANDKLPNVFGCGVVDHCKLINSAGYPAPYETRTLGYGVYARLSWSSPYWDDNRVALIGKYSNRTLFVEDCYFQRWRHSMASNQAVHYVFRYNTIKNDWGYVGSVDAHGQENAANTATMVVEIYGNTILDPIMPRQYTQGGVGLRGGCGVVFNNTIGGYYYGIQLFYEAIDDKYALRDMYVWGNTITGATQPYNFGSGLVENVNYFLYALPGYEPYPYPHPLTLAEAPPQETTPFLGQLEEGVYVVSVPSIVTVTPDTYNFKQWNDGDTNPTKTINLTSDTSLTATYEKAIGLTTLRGIVKDNKGNPIADADVKCNGVSTKTLADGSYEFKDLENRQYTITISKAGYQSITMQVDASNGGTINLPETMLSPTPIISSWIIPAAVLSLLAVVTVVAVRKKGG